MSIGNLKDQGNKGNNFPYQLRTLQLLGAINDGITALPGVDHESRTSTYQAINNGVGYSIGNIIIRYDIIDLATGLLEATIWFNDSLQTQITPAPLPGDLTPATQPVNQVEKTGVSGYTAAIIDLTATDIIVAPGVGLFNYITQILVTNSHATVGTLVTIQTEDGTGLYAGYAAPAGGGFSVSFVVPIKMPVANKKLQAICGTTGANVYVSASGYKAA